MKIRNNFLLAILIASCAHAVDQTGATKIGMVGSYNQYGNGDAVFTVSNPTQQCGGGFWLTKSDPGFSANMAMIVSAFIAKTTVNVAALTDQRWSGGPNFCKLYTIQIVAE